MLQIPIELTPYIINKAGEAARGITLSVSNCMNLQPKIEGNSCSAPDACNKYSILTYFTQSILNSDTHLFRIPREVENI